MNWERSKDDMKEMIRNKKIEYYKQIKNKYRIHPTSKNVEYQRQVMGANQSSLVCISS